MKLENFKSLNELIDALIQEGKAANRTDARKKALALIPKEQAFQSKIMQYLKTVPGVCYWKDQAGMYQAQGVPDVIVIKNGLFYGFEIKRPFIGVLSPIQAKFHDKIKQAGGRVYVVSFVSEVKKILEEC